VYRILSWALLSAMLLLASVSLTAAEPSNLAERLRTDVASGSLSGDDALLYATIALTNPRLLPERYYARAKSGRAGNALVAMLIEELPDADPQVRALVRYVLSPPNRRASLRSEEPRLNSSHLNESRMPSSA